MVSGVVVTLTVTAVVIAFVPVIVIVVVPGPTGVTMKTFGLPPATTVATAALLPLVVNGPFGDATCVTVTFCVYDAPTL